MNVAERAPVRASQVVPEPSPQGPASSPRSKLKPLAALLPYIWRYRGRAAAAVGALVLAAIATLAVPVAVRRMIDFGFTISRCENV